MPTPTFAFVTQEELVSSVQAIAHQIRDWMPHFIVGIGRGGLVPAVFLSHASDTAMLSIDGSAGLPDFSDALLARLAGLAKEGKRLLFVDDINDTGRTIATLRRTIEEAGAAMENVRFATLIDNVRSTQRVDYHARQIDRATDKQWFVFPWEAVAPATVIARDAAEVPERTA